MRSELTFRDCTIVVQTDNEGTVRLTVAGGPCNVATVTLGADAAALVGADMERAALKLRRIERDRLTVEGKAA